MANFPTSLDTPASDVGATSDPLALPSHVTAHTNMAAIALALETKVGADGSAVATSIDYLIRKRPLLTAPANTITQTLDRATISSITLAALTSAQLTLVAVPLVKGQVVTSITFLSGSTAANTPTNQWFALYSSARALLGVTSDDTTTAWGANATKTLTLAAAYTATVTDIFYIACLVKATVAVPTLAGVLVPNTTALNIPPIITGTSTAALTNPASAPNPAAAITVSGSVPFAYVL